MSAFKKIAGLITGVSAVGVLGVALAQGVPPNPRVSNPALGAGEQSASGTLIGETGVLPWAPQVEQTAVITPQDQQAAVASQPAQDTSQQVASSDTSSQPSVQPSPNDNAQMGAAPSQDMQPHAARSDRG